MTRSPDDLPPALESLWRTVKLGYRAEPRGLVLAFAMTLFMALPDALIALWLKFLADGFQDHDRSEIMIAAFGLAASATATWFLRVVFTRVQRRFRDKISVALEAHVATLQASVATIEHHERPEYLDRLSVLRDQVFALDHLFMSLFSTVGWIIRLGITLLLLVSVSPILVFLPLFAIPIMITSTSRPGVERRVEESVAPHDRLARHLFQLGTVPAAGKELRVEGIGNQLVHDRRESWDLWYHPVAHARTITALWHTLAWALFGGAYVGAIVYVTAGLRAGVGDVLLVVAAGSRLSQYVGAAVGELGFLRGIWLDSSRRLAWLEDYAASRARTPDANVPERIASGIRLEHVSFAYPGTDHDALTDVDLELPAGAVIALVGENGAGKSTLVKLLADMYTPASGRITIDGVDLARMDPEEWRKRLAGAFQDFYRFEFLAQTSVGVGDHPNIEERPAVERAVDRAGAAEVVSALSAGLDTQLGPTWDAGVDLSFGQWQKLALARGFMRDDPLLLVLDEPTAALDAETEHALFERFAQAARQATAGNGRVTILVSHRFSTVRMADLIVVLDGARVVEVGTHEDLIARAGQYADLYAIQARGVPLMPSEFVRGQPDFFSVAPASAPSALDMGSAIWCSPGMSSTYLVATDDGRIVVNTGMWFEARTHKRNYDEVTSTPTRFIILTQSHTDHIGGVETFRESGTQLIAQANISACQADDKRIHGLRIRRSLPFFADVMGQSGYARGDPAVIPPLPAPAQPDVTFDDVYTFECGGRRLELISVPGGETIDSLVVWLPDDGVALVGNLFSALFGHFPNLVTMRGDRMRSGPAFVASVQRVIDLGPELLLLGHHGPVRGTPTIRAECERIRDAVQHVYDATIDAMNDGRDVWAAMREIRLPEHLDLGDAYGRVDWSVHAIWETYAGWFHQHSTLDLYGASPEQSAGEIVDLAGGADAVALRAAALTATHSLTAIRLCELTLAVDPEHRVALDAYRRAHEQLLAEHGHANFWLTRWLEGEVRSATNRLERLDAS